MNPGETSGREPVRPEIALSWKRSALSGVGPGDGFDADPATDLDLSSRLLRAARPILDEVAIQIAGTGLCLLLADRDCRIVARVFDNHQVERKMEKLGAVIGSRFGEDTAGTNAIGTPVEVRRGIVINGEEHYLERLKGLSCYGHPILHPVTHRVEGILDMTCIAPRANSLFAPFLQRAAADIERRLLEGSRASEQRLVDAFQRVSPQRHVAVAAIGEDILLSNRTALDLLDVADHAALRGLAADLLPDQSRTVNLELASGQLAKVQADRIAGTNGGTLFLVEQVHRQHVPIRRRADRAGVVDRARSELRRVRATAESVAIVGESGSGRTTAVRDLAGVDAVHWTDASRIPIVGQGRWLSALLEQASTSGGVLAVEHAHLLPASILPVVTDLLVAEGGPRMVLTSSPIEELPPAAAAMIARCPERIAVPPLRQRLGELPEIAQAMLDEIEPGLSLTSTALEALVAGEWPGNLTELRVVLTRTARDRASTRLGLADLPDAYRTSSRVSRLAGRERAERQAIIDALQECGGNKVHAAAKLGISRSTLYSRIRALEVTP
ncbi:transcriptional regulator of acetoin/glycerol metabolism [Rhodococcus sp. PvR044]|jgi:sigma-54 dependent transcriptional regulator, acetoin dehydrogenase operon transcriptional activator AcoR|uniref:sigma-54-dependent Fis family transcriptional regulator n=1 Tax=Rhodococcus TaxID=1827 RepID=UPI000BD1E3C5|nr:MULTISPECIES: helix-turn-helix domain-containing protein [Rhodococcus]MBP1162700.1 transcriptional regulator of acetoin/glycerol metabolism [Rhodococcus sp. PvR099]MCZ4555382.1 Fis family transcriptional regulator [Rhodococcus maanshanensis]PTR44065.1 regulatory Fis family protein [Rhodococcus sp. OK611]SNX90367.1 regulatory protein, Fis family [Rhodococcus sp. OK270]